MSDQEKRETSSGPSYVHPFAWGEPSLQRLTQLFEMAVLAMQNASSPRACRVHELASDNLIVYLMTVYNTWTGKSATEDEIRNMVLTAIEQREIALAEAARSIKSGETLKQIAQHPEVLHFANVRGSGAESAAEAALDECVRMLGDARYGYVTLSDPTLVTYLGLNLNQAGAEGRESKNN